MKLALGIGFTVTVLMRVSLHLKGLSDTNLMVVESVAGTSTNQDLVFNVSVVPLVHRLNLIESCAIKLESFNQTVSPKHTGWYVILDLG